MNIDAEKYFAAYEAACSLAILVELIEAGYLSVDGELVEDAKAKLRKLAKIDGSDIFTRFEKVGHGGS